MDFWLVQKTGRKEINVDPGSNLHDIIKCQQPADYKTNIWIQWIEINAIIPLHTVINTFR
jgi:hypothetical protein